MEMEGGIMSETPNDRINKMMQDAIDNNIPAHQRPLLVMGLLKQFGIELAAMTAAKELVERDRDMLNAKDVSKTREINLLVGENRKLAAELAAMTARVDHIGSSLAVVTAERDALRRDHNGCALWAEGARRERDRLKAELAAMTVNAQWYKDEWEKMRKAYAHECDPKIVDRLEAMTAELGLAKRQVKLLANIPFEQGVCWSCPAENKACMKSGEACRNRLAAWSRDEAEGGKG
jgi:hypothetical protein